jgi:hypothetical protein
MGDLGGAGSTRRLERVVTRLAGPKPSEAGDVPTLGSPHGSEVSPGPGRLAL